MFLWYLLCVSVLGSVSDYLFVQLQLTWLHVLLQKSVPVQSQVLLNSFCCSGVADQGTCSATNGAVHLPSKCVSPKQQGGNHLPVFCLLISSSSASHLAFLYSNGKFLSSWFPKEGLTSSCFACTFLEWFNPPFWPFLFRCNSGPLWLFDFSPSTSFFFFFSSKRMNQEGQKDEKEC